MGTPGPLTVEVSRQQCAGGDCCKKPHAYDCEGGSDGGPPSNFFFPACLGRIGLFTAFREHVCRGNLLEELYSKEKNQPVVQKSNHRNEVWDQLNGTK